MAVLNIFFGSPWCIQKLISQKYKHGGKNKHRFVIYIKFWFRKKYFWNFDFFMIFVYFFLAYHLTQTGQVTYFGYNIDNTAAGESIENIALSVAEIILQWQFSVTYGNNFEYEFTFILI